MSLLEEIRNSHVLLYTDVEADDIIAMKMLVNMNVIPVKIYCDCRNDGYDRMFRLKQFVSEHLAWKDIPIIRDKYQLLSFGMLTGPKVIISLANMYPLYYLSSTIFPYKLAEETTVLQYGSVNIRWAKKELMNTDKFSEESANIALSDLMTRVFKKFYLFETFHAFGTCNQANNDVAPEFIAKLCADNLIKSNIESWNTHCMVKCIEDIKEDPTFADLTLENVREYDLTKCTNYSAKIITSILKYPYQSVAADYAAIASIVDESKYVRKNIVVGSYTTLDDPDESSTAYVYIGDTNVEGIDRLKSLLAIATDLL
jgi:hypothetical protein